MKAQERLWWMMLSHAESVSQYVPKEDLLLHVRVNGLIRCTLRDKFKLNLDTLSDKARNQYQDMIEAERLKDEECDRLLESLGLRKPHDI